MRWATTEQTRHCTENRRAVSIQPDTNPFKSLSRTVTTVSSTSVEPAEIEKFAAMADDWWSVDGKFKPLHALNPVRVGFIRDAVCKHFGRDPFKPGPLDGLSILDIGCGGGLLCEPLARLGATVTGIDATPDSIAVAKTHAESMGLTITYEETTAEAVFSAGAQYDVVVSMEVVEHVVDASAFLQTAGALVRPGGCAAFATLNRTPKSYALAIVGAEYLLGWLPRGTHDWKKFVKPSEMVRAVAAGGVSITHLTGAVYDPINNEWRTNDRDLDVNYMAFGTKPGD